MPTGATYALLPELKPGAKPWTYPSLTALARRIHRDRRGEALHLEPGALRFRDRARDVVTVYAAADGRLRLIGHAWLAGVPYWSMVPVLSAALDALEPSAGVYGSAA